MKTMGNKNMAALNELAAALQLLECTKSSVEGSKRHLALIESTNVSKHTIDGNLWSICETLEVVANSLGITAKCLQRAYKSLNQ